MIAKAILLLVLAALVFLAYRKRPIGMAVWGVIIGVLALTTSPNAFLVVGTILLSILTAQPLFVLMGGLSTLGLVLVGEDLSFADLIIELSIVIDKMLELASKEVLLAIPFFVVAGELMTQGSLAQRLIDVAKAVFGWMPGGLAVAGVAGCVFFAAISGSSPVTVIAIGSIMVPALLKSGYPKDFALGLFTTAGSLGILIPPSIPMIVYSIMVGATTPVDPKDLFLAGIMPGALIGGMLAAYAIWTGVRHKLPTDDFSPSRIFEECRRGIWSLFLPFLILGGIYSGVFTATEAAAVSVVYALIVELFIHGELKPRDLVSVAENSMTVMGALFLIIALAIGLNHVLVLEQIPEQMVEWLQSLNLSRAQFLVIVNLFLLVVGMFMDIMSAILIIAPMLAPMSAAMGIDPLHMGIIFIVNLEIGYCTPPIGLNLFVASTLFRVNLGDIIRAVIRPLVLMLLGLMVVTWMPALSLGLGRALDGKPVFGDAKPSVEAPVEVPAAKPSGEVKSLQELMKSKSSRPDPVAPTGKVKSLQELMKAAKGGGGVAADPAAPAKVKSLQELMKEAKGKKTAPSETADPAKPARVKSLKELMEEAKAK